MLACSSPKLFAACHVLHRRLVPRHPPLCTFPLDQIPFGFFLLPSLGFELGSVDVVNYASFASSCPPSEKKKSSGIAHAYLARSRRTSLRLAFAIPISHWPTSSTSIDSLITHRRHFLAFVLPKATRYTPILSASVRAGRTPRRVCVLSHPELDLRYQISAW